MVASVARASVHARSFFCCLLYNVTRVYFAVSVIFELGFFFSPRSRTDAMADAEQQFMETAEENGYEGGENGAEGYDDGGASAELQAEAGAEENNGAGEGAQDGDGSRIEASKSEEDAGYVSLKRVVS